MTLIISLAVFVSVAALIGGVAIMFRSPAEEVIENRLDALTGKSTKSGTIADQPDLLAGSLDDVPGMLESVFSRITNVRLLLEQADVSISPPHFVLGTLILGGLGAVVPVLLHWPWFLIPTLGLALAVIPLLTLLFRRSRRRKAFGKQLPEALELVARALRAGHSLQAGFQLVGQEMADPIGTEFSRVFEEQNLGVSLEESLDDLSDRVPNMDLRFFATAIILQRQTGGDLAEILDKIGSLIRERFKIYGAIQALTGEGRLSGIVLLALPPTMFLITMKLNYDYIMVLFTDPIGKKLIAGALVLQLLGALVIRKIVNIKV